MIYNNQKIKNTHFYNDSVLNFVYVVFAQEFNSQFYWLCWRSQNNASIWYPTGDVIDTGLMTDEGNAHC